mmetsp:Transcript_1013/g.1639  ORF Transcript_1013/g.1639 Transcript_1013/m.1639 type:complete len:116 (-) Transcript_1013:695-1042(-)
MAPKAGHGILGGQKNFVLNSRSIAGILLALAWTGGFYSVCHLIHVYEVTHRAIHIALPFTTMVYIALLIPMCMFVTYSEDFKPLHPLNPLHFVRIVGKYYRHLERNNMKVSAKDL